MQVALGPLGNQGESASELFLMAAAAAKAWTPICRVEPITPAAAGARHPGHAEVVHPNAGTARRARAATAGGEEPGCLAAARRDRNALTREHRSPWSRRARCGTPLSTRLGVPNPYFADQLVPAALGLVNELGDPAEVESRADEKARATAAIPSRGFAISKRMRTDRLCATIRCGFPAQLEQFLDAWFGEGAQRLLRATADQIRRPSA